MHVVLSALRQSLATDHPALAAVLADPRTRGFVSVASLCEIAIKTRLGKLDPGLPLLDLDGYLHAIGLEILSVESTHVVAVIEPESATRDPFDRLLLAVCRTDQLYLATLDRALVGHPLALRVPFAPSPPS